MRLAAQRQWRMLTANHQMRLIKTSSSPCAANASLFIALAVVVIITGIATRDLQAVVTRHDANPAAHEAIAAEHPEVGYWGFGGEASCSGVLVTETKVLTAAHCVNFDMIGDDGTVSSEAVGLAAFSLGEIQPNPVPNVSRIQVNPSWVAAEGEDDALDLAVIHLATPITDVPLPRVSLANPDGRTGTIVGYGLRGNGRDGLNVIIDEVTGKISLDETTTALGATNILHVVSPSDVPFRPVSDTFLSYDFDSPEDPSRHSFYADRLLPTEGAGAPRDSGGPIYAEFGGQELFVVGINSAGQPPPHLLPEIDPSELTPELIAQYAGTYGTVGSHPLLALPANAEFLAANSVPVVVPEPGGSQSILVLGLTVLLFRRQAIKQSGEHARGR